MREIIFRGKRLLDNEWEYGGYAHTENKKAHIIYNQVHSLNLKGHTVDPDTVGQFTGLTDKNGKKIFEGDIVKIFLPCKAKSYIGVIRFGHYANAGHFKTHLGFYIEWNDKDCINRVDLGFWIEAYQDEMEVIGDIYDYKTTLIYPFMTDSTKYVDKPLCFTEYVVSVDYGTVNPCSAGLWGKYKDSWYRINEYYFDSRAEGYQRTDEEHYNVICQMIGDREIKEFIIDPSAASFIEIVRRKQKFNVVVATIGNIHSDIKLVYDSLKNGKIKICKNCKNAKREFGMYKWEINRYGTKVPVKMNDHAMDDIRYFTATVSNLQLKG